MDRFVDESGLFAIAGHAGAARVALSGVAALAHRGDKAGVVSGDGYVLRATRGEAAPAEIDALVGTVAVAQAGSVDAPLLVRLRAGAVAIAMAGKLTNAARLRGELLERGAVLSTGLDAEVVLQWMAQSTQRTLVNRLVDALWKVEGAFSLVICDAERVIAVRDPRGFRPLVLGRVDGGMAVASEDGAIRAVGGEPVREVAPGEMVILDGVTTRSVSPFLARPRATCVQEVVGIARVDARIAGDAVYSVRVALGDKLAEEQPAPRGELVVPVPDSGVPAALGYARRSKLRLEHALSQGVGVPAVVAERRVVLIAASLLTGGEVDRAAQALRGAGARELHVRVASPMARAGCPYGVAGPTTDELAVSADLAALTAKLGVDSVGFLSTDGLRSTVGAAGFCDACLSLENPIPPEEPEPQLALF